jgi:hypothetical protein
MDPAGRACWTSGEEAQASPAVSAAAFAAAGQAVTLKAVPKPVKRPPLWRRWLNALLYHVTGTDPKNK